MHYKYKPGQLVVTNAKASKVYTVTKKGVVCQIQDVVEKCYIVTLVKLLPDNQWSLYEALKFPVYKSMQSKARMDEFALDPYTPGILTSRRANAN